MANPLFKALQGGSGIVNDKQQTGNIQAPQMTIQDALREVHEHPADLFQQAGYSVPQECIGNNQATVMHLLRSGQIGSPMMRIIAPLLGRMGIR